MPEYSLTYDPTADAMPYTLCWQACPMVRFRDAAHAADALAAAEDAAHTAEPPLNCWMAAQETQRYGFQRFEACVDLDALA